MVQRELLNSISMWGYDKEDLEKVEDLENDVKPGEILHCKVYYTYTINKKVHKENVNEAILKDLFRVIGLN